MDYFSLVNNALSSDDRALAKENGDNEAVDCPNISVIGASGDGPETESNQDARPPTTDNDVKERDENYNRNEECPQAKGICLGNDEKQLELARTDVGDIQQERTKLYDETVTNCRKPMELVTTDANANSEGHIQDDRGDRRSMSTPSSPSHVAEMVEKIENGTANIGDASSASAINGGGGCGGAGSANENQLEKSNRYKEIAEEFLKVCYEDEIVQNNFLRQYNQIFEKVIKTVLDSSSPDNPALTVKTIRAKYDEQRKIVHAERNAQRNNLKVLIQEMLATETAPFERKNNNQEVTGSLTNEVGRQQQQQQQQQQQRWSTFSYPSKLDEERQQVLLRSEDKERCNGNYCCLKSTGYNCSNSRFASQMISNHPRTRPAFHYRLATPVSQMNFQNHAFSTSAARTRRHSAIISRFSNANRTNAISAAPAAAGRFQNKSHGLNSVGFINSNSSEVINWRSREPVVATAAATASSGAVSVGNEEDGRIVSSAGAAASNQDDPTNENDWFGYKKHPTQLVHEICGKNLSVSCTTISMNSKPLHEVTYKVGSDTFHAIAETKKEAKRRCAIRVLKSINILH